MNLLQLRSLLKSFSISPSYIFRPIIKEGGLFSSATIHYLLETEPTKWKVKRTFADVLWLREQLSKQFPGFLVSFLINLSYHLSTKKARKTKLYQNQ